MFESLKATSEQVQFSFNDVAVTAQAGQSVAAALLLASDAALRTTPVSGEPRKPYCMMGVCFDCLVTIDGKPNQQACMVTVRAGMQVASQNGAADTEHAG